VGEMEVLRLHVELLHKEALRKRPGGVIPARYRCGIGKCREGKRVFFTETSLLSHVSGSHPGVNKTDTETNSLAAV
jgi:hypothetical protein